MPAVSLFGMRRLLIVLLSLVLLVPLAQAVQGKRAFSLAAGQSAFWNGPHVEEGGGDNWIYALVVKERAYRLRIGIDHPEVGDVYQVEVTDPNDGVSRFSPGSGLYSQEMLAKHPAVGTWVIKVTAQDVTDSAFRMRAKLEARPPALGVKKGPVLPNMQVLPPHEPSFLFPVTNGSTDGEPQGIDNGGTESCHQEERVEDGALRCLRFAFGVRNTGRGPMHLRIGPGTAGADRDLFQIISRADKSTFERPAGKAVYHESHGHYHHDGAIGLRLFRVVDPGKGELEAGGPKRTKGFAHREELLRDWNRFYPIWSQSGFGLRPGWSDIYEWDRPGNYVDFGLSGDGRYVIRMWADPVRGILESNEKDNLAYTYLEVMGSDVELIEVGRGRDPWDPCKIEMGPGGYPDPPRKPRPARCPPDTT